MIGAADLGPGRGERRQRVTVGVAVGVVDPGGDEPDVRSDPREEGRVGGRRAVVGHGEQAGTQGIGPTRGDPVVGQRLEVGLRGPFDVPGGQRHPVLPGRPQHDRTLVELAGRVPVRTPGRGAEHLEVEVPDRHLRRRDHLPDRDARHRRGRVHHLDGGDALR